MTTTTKKKKRRKKTTGSRLAAWAACLLLASAATGLSEKPKKQPTADAAAFIGVSVFREPGYAVPGAELRLSPTGSPATGAKSKPAKGITGPRGEFVFHVPPGPMQYVVSATAKGLATQQKTVSVQGEERVDVTFMLESESK